MIANGQAIRRVALRVGCLALLAGILSVGAMAAGAMAAGTTPTGAMAADPLTSAGPGRIVCKSATACELGIGTPAKLRYRINVTALPAADQDRLVKQCTARAAPCVATVEGTEMGDPIKIKAARITWYN
jgi:hypothetical protein